ncbi:MAG: PSD1 and planctomycete cytochrome C domain-containing protein [Candidatus Hydrogenedentota bacterium]
MKPYRIIVAPIVVAFLSFNLASVAIPPQFTEDIWPILDQHCIRCHGEAKTEGELRLDTPDAMETGGEFGVVIDRDDLIESSLLELVALPSDDPDRMPSKGDPLSEQQIDLLRTWILEGASTEGWTQQLADTSNAKAKAYWDEKKSKPVILPATFSTPVTNISFNKHIRPILSNSCFACHGPDSAARKAHLRLDLEEDAKAVREDGAAIVARDATTSELVKRIFHHDIDEAMPPHNSGKTLTDADRHLLAAWIEQDAEYEPLWSYITPTRPKVASINNDGWSKNAIDQILLANLKIEGVQPSAKADPVTLVRRIHYDLTGLPPTTEVVDGFVADPSGEAYSKMVDSLLASPAYGERMAIDWLDQVRYADSNGYHSDEERVIFPYRDYVINAFNSNKSFDEFTIEQLAGDLLDNPTQEQLVATGFNRLNQITAEGGAQGKEYRAKYNADRVRALGSIWLGTTLECAECHDHKFDPVATKEFYQFAAFFADLEEDDVYPGRSTWAPILRLPNDKQKERLDKADAQIERLKMSLQTTNKKTEKDAKKWLKSVKPRNSETTSGWLPLTPTQTGSDNHGAFELQPDLSILSVGLDAPQDVHEFTFVTDQKNITGIRFDAFSHPSFVSSLSRYRRTPQLNEIEIFATSSDASTRTPVTIKSGTLSFDRDKNSPKRTFDGNLVSNWRYSGGDDPRNPIAWMYEFEEPIEGGRDTTITVRLHYLALNGEDRSAFGRVRVSATTDNRPRIDAAVGVPERFMAAKRGHSKSGALLAQALPYYLTIDSDRDFVRDALKKAHIKRLSIINGMPFTLYSRALPIPRETRLLPRGNWLDDSGPIVTPDVPEFLPPLSTSNPQPNRLDLAQWLVNPDNPLTARVYVNRLWKLFFGRGLSGTLDDLGTQGEMPTHPEILDWLSVEFVESGWDTQHVIRLITESAAYQQSSNVSPELLQRDPQNKLVARQSTFRYEAEMVRDTALTLSGLLENTIGGASVRPYQPEGYWEHLNFPKRKWEHDENESQYRRGLYIHWQRSFLHPSMMAFDAPSREECTAERAISNTPLQALTLLNDPTYVEASKAFASRIINEGGASTDAKISWALRQAISRIPSSEEVSILNDVYAKHKASFSETPENATNLLAIGMFTPPENTDAAELAAWTSVARIILNLHETITRS